MQIEAFAHRQAGAFSRVQAVGSGLTPRQIEHRVKTGQWQRLLPAVYVHAAAPVTLLTKVWAAVLCLGPPVAVSHGTAAWLWNLAPADTSVHVTVPRARRVQLPSGYRVHRKNIGEVDAQLLRGLPSTTAVRTVVDCLRLLPRAPGLQLLENALRQGAVTMAQLEAAMAQTRGWAGNAAAGRRLAEVSDAWSTAERRLHELLRAAGLTGWTANFRVIEAGILIGIVDVAFPAVRLAIEVDGMAWHVQPERFQQDRTRQNALVDASWTVLRFTWRDLMDRPDTVIRSVRNALVRLEAA